MWKQQNYEHKQWMHQNNKIGQCPKNDLHRPKYR